MDEFHSINFIVGFIVYDCKKMLQRNSTFHLLVYCALAWQTRALMCMHAITASLKLTLNRFTVDCKKRLTYRDRSYVT